jgi:hypothetical protein
LIRKQGSAIQVFIESLIPGAPDMTAARPSPALMTAFILTAAALVAAAASPILQIAASVVA